MTNIDSVFKSRDITLPTNVHLVKAVVFPVVMYGYESWTVKKAEHQRIDAFELWCWRRLLRVSPLDCKEVQPVHSKGDRSWVFIGRTDAKAETPALWPPQVKSWHIGKDSCWEELGEGGEGEDRGWDGWMASPTQWTWVWVNSKSWWWTGGPGMLRFMGSQRVRHDWATELNWHNILSVLVLVFKTVNLISFCTVNVSIRLVKKVSSMVNVKTAPAIMLAFILTYFHRELALMNLLWEVLNQILCQDFTLMSKRWLDLFSVKIDIMVTSSSVKLLI